MRGRVARLGPVVDEVLTRHAYPEPVANLLGEACALAALVGASLKFDGRLIVQAQGDGPVSLAVADYDTSGGLRGYCNFDPERVEAASAGFARPGARSLLGEGVFIMTIDQGPDMDRYQGVTPIEGETLALCAETYFGQSEQTPTRVRLAVGHVTDAQGDRMARGRRADPEHRRDSVAREEAEEPWARSQALFETLGEDELVDPTLASEKLLYRLFHEDGVRLFEAKPLEAVCRCSRERILTVLQSFPAEERAEMVEEDGVIRVTCQYCSRVYDVAPDAVEG